MNEVKEIGKGFISGLVIGLGIIGIGSVPVHMILVTLEMESQRNRIERQLYEQAEKVGAAKRVKYISGEVGWEWMVQDKP